jgi:hypothetical protein
VRGLVLALALGLDLALGALLVTRHPGAAELHPAAPPLTRIAALGDRPLTRSSQGIPDWTVCDILLRRIGTTDQIARVDQLRRRSTVGNPLRDRADTLRVEIATTAAEMAAVLGGERVRVAVARRESLAARYGEQKVWDQALAAVREP